MNVYLYMIIHQIYCMSCQYVEEMSNRKSQGTLSKILCFHRSVSEYNIITSIPSSTLASHGACARERSF